ETEPETLYLPGERPDVRRNGARGRGRVLWIVAGERLEHDGDVRDVARERPNLIERRGVRDHAEARHAAVRRLQPGDAPEGGGEAEGAAGVGPERGVALPGGDRDRGAARGSARDARGIPGVPRRAERGVLGRGAHRELVAVELPDDHRTSGAEPRRHGRVER